MTIEEAEELVESWVNGNRTTILKEIETKEDMAKVTKRNGPWYDKYDPE